MTRLAILTAALAVGTGCIFVDADGPHHHTPGPVVVVPVNEAPIVLDGFASCYYDDYNRDDVVWFEADVDDPNGALDVVQAWADVYDGATGELVETFELYPTDDPYVWFSDWLVSTTYFDCWYPYYEVDLQIYDASGASDILTILPDSYR
ncbi:MAG: hypothetical protein H6733_09035 [Alphaproteobacteria bacterium]|nr:hypothetical protein [Alphaproteobacteria bacterium]